MITSIDAFLRYFDAVHRRALRDVGALPPAADGWKPETGEGEKAWSINGIVGHMASSRLYFAGAYRGEGWILPPPRDVSVRASWLPALEESATAFHSLLDGTPDEWLTRRVPLIDTDGAISGWRVLMMMVEHEVHHRSQLDTYAGMNGWDVPQIYGRSAEQVGEQQAAQRALHRSA
jgi:uncharacterized damage-inducible protein DinB